MRLTRELLLPAAAAAAAAAAASRQLAVVVWNASSLRFIQLASVRKRERARVSRFCSARVQTHANAKARQPYETRAALSALTIRLKWRARSLTLVLSEVKLFRNSRVFEFTKGRGQILNSPPAEAATSEHSCGDAMNARAPKRN